MGSIPDMPINTFIYKLSNISYMVNKKICPYCKETIEYDKGMQFTSHCGNCKQRPGYRDGIEKQRQTILRRRKDFEFKCKKCKKPYIVNLTPHQYKHKFYRLHCSRRCANSKICSVISRKKKSIANIKYYQTHSHPSKGLPGRPHTLETKQIISESSIKRQSWKNFQKNPMQKRHHGNELIYKSLIEKYFKTINLKPQKIVKHWFDFVNEEFIIEFTMSTTGGVDNATNRFRTIINDDRKKFLICSNIYFGKKRKERLFKLDVQFVDLNNIGVLV